MVAAESKSMFISPAMMMWLKYNESSVTTCCNPSNPAQIPEDGEWYTDTTHNWRVKSPQNT